MQAAMLLPLADGKRVCQIGQWIFVEYPQIGVFTGLQAAEFSLAAYGTGAAQGARTQHFHVVGVDKEQTFADFEIIAPTFLAGEFMERFFEFLGSLLGVLLGEEEFGQFHVEGDVVWIQAEHRLIDRNSLREVALLLEETCDVLVLAERVAAPVVVVGLGSRGQVTAKRAAASAVPPGAVCSLPGICCSGCRWKRMTA